MNNVNVILNFKVFISINEDGYKKVNSLNITHSNKKRTTSEYRRELHKLVIKALDGKHMGISVSETDFGTSMYLQDSNVKMRFSDHGVGIKRFGEDLHDLSEIFEYPNSVIKNIRSNFSDDFVHLVVIDGSRGFNVRRINKSELIDWEQVVVKSSKEIHKAIPLVDIDNYDIVQKFELTKKKDKIHAKINVPSFMRGVRNKRNGEIISIYAPVMYNQLNDTDIVIESDNT